MLHRPAIVQVLGTLLLVTGASMALPLVCSLYYGGDDLPALAVSASRSGSSTSPSPKL